MLDLEPPYCHTASRVTLGKLLHFSGIKRGNEYENAWHSQIPSIEFCLVCSSTVETLMHTGQLYVNISF